MDIVSWIIIGFFILIVIILVLAAVYFFFFRGGNTGNTGNTGSVGACCSSSNNCTMTTSSNCTGKYQGDGTTCVAGICSSGGNFPINTPVAIVANMADSNGVISHDGAVIAALPNWNCDPNQRFMAVPSQGFYYLRPVTNPFQGLDAITNGTNIVVQLNSLTNPVQQTALWDIQNVSGSSNFFTIRNVGQSDMTGDGQFLSTINGIDNVIMLISEPSGTTPTGDNSIFNFTVITGKC